MLGKMKVGVFLSVALLPILAGPTLAEPCPPKIPMTGINTDGYFPPGVDPICGFRITVYGSQPINFYTGPQNPWGAPVIQPDPLHPGFWTLTFGDPVNGPCFPRNSPAFKRCGVFKGIHFGFYTDDPIVNLLNPNSAVWSQLGPPCVYFGPNGEVPCTGLTSHWAGNAGLGVVQIANANAAAAAAGAKVQSQAQALRIQNVRVAVAPDIVPINNLNPCDLGGLAWEEVPLANSLLPASTEDGGVGTLNVTIPDHILEQEGWAVMVYDVADPASGEVLTTSTLDFPLLGRRK